MPRYLVSLLLALAGCSTVIEGSSQTLTVRTPGASGADCILSSPDGTTYYVRTPGTVGIGKSRKDLTVHCRKAGYRDGIGTLRSSFDVLTLGNVVTAGLGAGVDAATGAMHEYPKTIDVYMAPANDDFINFLAPEGPARWTGQGRLDACGQPWAADVHLRGREVTGKFWRGNVEYTLGGRIDRSGRLADAQAARSSGTFGRTGPRFIRITLDFDVDRVTGTFAIDGSGQFLCRTELLLKRSAV